MLKKKLKLIKAHTKANRNKLLDFGCGTGDFLLAAQKKGFDSIGYEPEIKARSRAMQKGVEVIESESRLFSNHTQQYDFITLWHVLEHLHKLDDKMKAFYKLLKPDALLILAVPMANSADAIFYRDHWAALDVPRHLYHFTPKTMELLCKANGFNIIKRKGLFFDSFYVSMLSEKYKNNTAGLVFSILRGLKSNIKALRKKSPWSSEIFVCKKA